MSTPRTHGLKILKAASSPLRLQILNLLYDKGPLTYTELITNLKLNPTRDAGRFAYHLKSLIKTDLIETIIETKKYTLTELGKTVIDLTDKIDKKAHKPKNILIRSSRSTIEEFDANKITNTLTKEAKMPPEEAQKIAKQAETQLLKSKTKYLTAPLVREVVNAILIEKGLEEYRHRLTRLGTPVHDVTTLLHTTTTPLEAAGQTVLKEYTLLNTLPRDIADAHLSGAIHIHNLSTWILKPTETSHDIRYFLKNGLTLEKTNPTQTNQPPPENLEEALNTLFNATLHTAKETETTQTLDYLNIFLAPYTKDLQTPRIREALNQFITNLTQHTNTTIGLETTTPDFIAEKPATNPTDKHPSKYKDYHEESQNLASLLLDTFIEKCKTKPLTNPKLIIKVRPETLKDERGKTLLLKAHTLATQNGTPYFANLTNQNNKQTVYSSTACKLETEPDGDWEIDTLRTGCLGTVTINLPRAAMESGSDKTKFLETLRERFEIANRALDIKHQALKQHGNHQLPFLMQNTNGDKYFRLENSTRIINLAGLKEALETLASRSLNEEVTLALAKEVTEQILAFLHKIGKKRGKYLRTAMLPHREDTERLAQLDIERYGIGKIRYSGTRERPYYSATTKITLRDSEIIEEPLTTQHRLRDIQSGGNLELIQLEEGTCTPDQLLTTTNQLIEKHIVEFFTYNIKTTFCSNCKQSWRGLTKKCPSCNSVSLTYYDRADET